MTTRKDHKDLKKVINHSVAAKRSLDAARDGLGALIDTTIEELESERRPGLTIAGLSATTDTPDILLDDARPVMIATQVFPLPRFDNGYAVARGLNGVIKLRELSDGVSESTIGIVVYTKDIPLVAVDEPNNELTIENVALALAELLRDGLIGTGNDEG